MLILCDPDDLPPPLKTLAINAMQLQNTSASLGYLDVKLTPILKRLGGEVKTAREQYEIHRALLRGLLAEHDLHAVDHAVRLLIELKRDASAEDMLDALANEFATAHACMKMHEDLKALRERVDNVKMAHLDVELSTSMRNLVAWLWRRVRFARRAHSSG